MRSPSFSASSSNQTVVSSARGGGAAGEGGGPGGSGKKAAVACCSKVGLKRGPWTGEEDEMLAGYVRREGERRWRTLPEKAGLLRCGESCRLRWMNYLRPSVKRGHITADEEDLILRLHRLLGNRWSLIAGRIPGRTDNEIENYWNTHLSKKLMSQGIDPKTHMPAAFINRPPNPSTDNIIINNKQNNNNNNPLFDHENDHVIINNSTTVQHGNDHNGIMTTNGDHQCADHDHDDMINNCCPDDAFSSS